MSWLNDTFTDTNGANLSAHVPDSGGGWALVLGTATSPKISTSFGGAAYANAAGYALWRSTTAAANVDQAVATSFYHYDDLYASFGPAARLASDGSRGYVGLYDKTASTYQIQRLVNGVLTKVAESVAMAFAAAGSSGFPSIEVSGSGATVHVVLKVGGAQVASYDDTDANRATAAGYGGFWWTITAVGSGVFLDSITGSDIGASSGGSTGGGTGGALTAGTASLASTSNASISLSVTSPTGGTAPVTGQWYRSTNPAALGQAVTGATGLALADSSALAADTTYFYTYVATDATNATANSNTVGAVLKSAPLKIGFLGDSITAGYTLTAGQDPVTQIVTFLKKLYKLRDITAVNQGAPGSATADWLPGAATSYLTNAKTAFASAGVTHVHIMLGANDASVTKGHVTAAAYKTNLQNIITDLKGAGYKVIVSYPIYYPIGANTGTGDAASVALLQAYQAQIDSLIDNVSVLRGDQYAFAYFADNIGELQASDQVHPTAIGAVSLAMMWAGPIVRNVLTAPAATMRTYAVQLATGLDGNSQPILAANQSGLKIRCYNPDGSLAFGTDAGTSDASGNVSLQGPSTAGIGASCQMDVIGGGHHYSGFVQVS